MNRIVLLILTLCMMVAPMYGETVRRDIPVFFRNDVDIIQPEYSINTQQLYSLDSLFNAIRNDSTLTLKCIELAGWASPPATVRYNIALSHRRADAVMNWLREHGVDFDSIIVSYNGVNYPLLSTLVRERGYHYADEVTNIIDRMPVSGETDNRRARLRSLRNGQVWRELTRDYFPEMRRTDVFISYNREEQLPVVHTPVAEAPVEIDTFPVEILPPPAVIAPVPQPHRSPLYWSVHTNTLFDLALIPNVGFELYLDDNISVATNWHYAWWDCKHRHRYWRTYGGHLELRWWFGQLAHTKPLTGHHLGLYAQVLLYDFELGGTGYLSGVPGKSIFHRPTWGGGIEYGFALPVARRLNIDFTIGVGYLQGRYWKYEPASDNYHWLSVGNRRYLGPTRLEVSLVWLIGKDNFNPTKGGDK